jgi:uncharacterized protein YraI
MRNAALTAAIAMPLAATAQQAIVNAGTYLRAGPDQTYPLVAQLAPGTPATVMGCLSDYGWCDVVVPGGMRGWLFSGRLDYTYQGVSVPLISIGAAIGVPIIAFSLDAYWGNYYRDRPWYREPHWWGGRRPPPALGWRRPPPPTPNWQPRPPPPQWRPPQRPDMHPQPPTRPPMVQPRPPGPPPGVRPPPPERSPGVRPPPPDRSPPEHRRERRSQDDDRLQSERR